LIGLLLHVVRSAITAAAELVLLHNATRTYR